MRKIIYCMAISLSSLILPIKGFAGVEYILNKVSSFSNVNAKQNRLEYLNEQIKFLTEMKNYYEAKSVRNRNRARVLQYQDYQTEARRMFKESDDYDKLVSVINNEISQLEKERESLLK